MSRITLRRNLMTVGLALVAAALMPLAVAAQIPIGTGDSKVYAVAAQRMVTSSQGASR